MDFDFIKIPPKLLWFIYPAILSFAIFTFKQCTTIQSHLVDEKKKDEICWEHYRKLNSEIYQINEESFDREHILERLDSIVTFKSQKLRYDEGVINITVNAMNRIKQEKGIYNIYKEDDFSPLAKSISEKEITLLNLEYKTWITLNKLFNNFIRNDSLLNESNINNFKSSYQEFHLEKINKNKWLAFEFQKYFLNTEELFTWSPIIKVVGLGLLFLLSIGTLIFLTGYIIILYNTTGEEG